MIGLDLGPYRLVSKLGEGGMGEVYRARDARLDRDVAIKILPDAFAADPDRVARFEREARAVAALSHPNILAVFDTGAQTDAAGQRRVFVVTELLDGETLRARLSALEGRGLPARKAIEIATRLANGLAAAHAKGLVHRDLKPENIFLLADGQVKILDFGLAKAIAPEPDSASAAAGETVAALTDPGQTMGTVGYMAPEQVRGHAVDARTDLFALGAVLHEMITGRRAFQRETAAETMTAVLREDPPDLVAARDDLPPALARIVQHCLEKNPAERFQTARDVAFALETLSGATSRASGVTPAVTAGQAPGSSRWARAAVAGVAAIAIAATAWAIGRSATTPVSNEPMSFARQTYESLFVPNARFMPDGTTVVYSAAKEGTAPRLFVLRPDDPAPQPLGQEALHLLSVSATGELAVLRQPEYVAHLQYVGVLSRMTPNGAPRPIVEHVRDADWAADGSLAIVRAEGNVDRVEYPIGTVLYVSTGYVSDLRLSPDGTRLAFMEHTIRFDNRGWVKVLDRSKQVITLTEEFRGGQGVAWSRDSRSIFYSATTADDYAVHRVEADGRTLASVRLTGASDLMVHDVNAGGEWLVSAAERRYGIMARTPDGPELDVSWLAHSWIPSLPPDGRTMVFTDGSAAKGADYAVAMRTPAGSPVTHLGPGNGGDISPDGKWAIAIVPTTLRVRLYPTGAGELRELQFPSLEPATISATWFPDSQSLLVCGVEKGQPPHCYKSPLAGGPLVRVSDDTMDLGRVTPDGRLVLAKDAAGAFALWPIEGGARRPVAGLGKSDRWAGWSGNGRVMFASTDGIPTVVDRVDLETGARTRVASLMPGNGAGIIGLGPVSMSEDGRTYAYGFVRNSATLYVVSERK